MYRNVGEVFKVGKVMLKVVPQIGSFDNDTQCNGCFFAKDGICCKHESTKNKEAGDCADDCRADSCNVIFVPTEESGATNFLPLESAEPMFTKRETLALEYCKACLPTASATRGIDAVVAVAFAFADEFIGQSEEFE